MKKEDKAIIIEQLGAKLKEYAHFYLVDVTAMNAAATSDLRRRCFKSDIKMIVVKNTLLHKALEAAEQLDVLCSIKSKNEVIAEVVALLQSPAKNVISSLQSAGQTIHGVLKTLGERPE